MPDRPIRLGVNIDHVATIRNARGGWHPDPVRAAHAAVAAGADGITAHLREDRRHIRDDDIERLVNELTRPLNFEMAATEEMVSIALRHRPHAACIVPERREERTTEGGLDVKGGGAELADMVSRLRGAGIRVSLFVEADPIQLEESARIGAEIVEIHTGRYCDMAGGRPPEAVGDEIDRIAAAAKFAAAAGLEVHAGHGLSYNTVSPIARMPEIVELNIGHFLMGEAMFIGIDRAVAHMRTLMHATREQRGDFGQVPS